MFFLEKMKFSGQLRTILWDAIECFYYEFCFLIFFWPGKLVTQSKNYNITYFILKNSTLYIDYLKSRQTKIEGFSICWNMPQLSTSAGAGLDQGHDPRTPRRPPRHWDHHLLLFRGCVSSKLE